MGIYQFYKMHPYSICSTSRHFMIFFIFFLCQLPFSKLYFKPQNHLFCAITHTPQPPTHPMSEGSVFLCWQEPLLALQSPVDRRRGRTSEEERPDRLSTALAGSMVSQSHCWGGYSMLYIRIYLTL